MAQFNPAYEIVRKHEGFYANVENDAGGETYAGISRVNFPNWDGWVIVDFRKARLDKPPLKNNEQIPGIEGKVKEFYQNLWQQSRAGEIDNQAVANIYFDFYILHSQAVRAMQEVLNSLGHSVAVDNIIGPQTIAAINTADPVKLHNTYKQKRIDMHKAQAAKYPSQVKFLTGWVQRAAGFSINGVGTTSIILALLLVGAGVYLYQENNKSKTQNK